MPQTLLEKKVAFLATHGVEEVELAKPRQALDQAGAKTFLVSPVQDKITAWRFGEWGASFAVDVPLEQARVQDFDALVLPGGVMNPDKLRINKQAVAFVRGFFDAGKPVAAICHAPWLLIEARVTKGRHLTSYISIKTDVENSGGLWTDQPVVIDHKLITSREPNDIPQFNQKIIELFAE
jgi:protease I